MGCRDAQADNPWPQWSRVCKTDYGQEEAIAEGRAVDTCLMGYSELR